VVRSLDSLPTWEPVTAGTPGGPIRTGIVDGRPGGEGETVVVTLGFRACVEPYEMQRFRLIASTLRARLVVVETPGFGLRGSDLTRAERRALRHGDFGPLASRMFAAATQVAGAEPTALLGYSLGASTGAAMARVAPLRTVVLVEPVALKRWRVPALVSATRREDRFVPSFLDENGTIADAVAPWDRRPGTAAPATRKSALLLLANALRRSSLAGDLQTAVPRLRRVVFVRGESTLLSPRRELLVLAGSLSDRGVPVRVLPVEGGHGFWQSLPRVGALAADLAGVL
jgi:pimeloyl-ACP methyl ester carboxylesterase